MTAKALKEAQAKELAIAEMYEEDAGAGFENVDKDSFAIPMFNILQTLSPQLKKTHAKYLEDAEESMIYNNVTDELHESLEVVPCGFKRSFVKWKPNRGGYAGELTPSQYTAIRNQLTTDEKGREYLPDGNQVQDTRTHYVLAKRSDGTFTPGVIAMSSTQIKKSKRWQSRMDDIKLQRKDGSKFTPAVYAHVWKLSSVQESNDQGDWHGWKIDLVGKVEDPDLYQAARDLHRLTLSEELEVKREEELTDSIPNF